MFIRQLTGKSMRTIITISMFVMVPFLSFPLSGGAEEYPNRSITLQVGFTPGGAAGICTQIFAEGIKKYLPNKQPVLVNYKPGASSAVAADFVLKQPADGYNLFIFPPDLAGKLAKDGPQLSFKIEDFIPIGAFASTPAVVTVNKENKLFTTLEDFIANVKKAPGKYSYASVGIGSVVHLNTEVFMQRTGIRLNHIPFAGAAAAVPALLGGHVDLLLGSVSAVTSHVSAGGGLRGLAVLAPNRVYDLPDIPTALEKGFDINRGFWYYLSAAKGTPPAVMNVLMDVFKKTANDPQIKSALTKAGYNPLNLTPEQTWKLSRAEYDLAKDVFQKAESK